MKLSYIFQYHILIIFTMCVASTENAFDEQAFRNSTFYQNNIHIFEEKHRTQKERIYVRKKNKSSDNISTNSCNRKDCVASKSTKITNNSLRSSSEIDEAAIKKSSFQRKNLIHIRDHDILKNFLDDYRLVEISNKRYLKIVGDGNCGYYSLIYLLYDEMKDPDNNIHKKLFNLRLPREAEEKLKNFIDAAKSILFIYDDYHKLDAEVALILVILLRIAIYNEVINNETRYSDFFGTSLLYNLTDIIHNPYGEIDNLALNALANILNLKINIVNYDEDSINIIPIFGGIYSKDVYLLYNKVGQHYDALRD